MKKLLRALLDRRKRTQQIRHALSAEQHIGDFRVKRAAIWTRRLEDAERKFGRDSDQYRSTLVKYHEAAALVRHERSLVHRLRSMLNRSAAKLRVWERRYHAELARSDVGAAAVHAARAMVGKHETGQNDGPWLREMEDELVHVYKAALAWMIPGNPYCGFGCDWSYAHGAHAKLPDNIVYTPNIPHYDGHTIGAYRFKRVPIHSAKVGALLPMNFGAGEIHHVGLKRQRELVGGEVKTREFNTSPGNGGSQSNGGGCYDRQRPIGFIVCAIEVTKVR